MAQQGGTKENNPGNFANDPQRASEAGEKGGRSRGRNRHNQNDNNE